MEILFPFIYWKILERFPFFFFSLLKGIDNTYFTKVLQIIVRYLIKSVSTGLAHCKYWPFSQTRKMVSSSLHPSAWKLNSSSSKNVCMCVCECERESCLVMSNCWVAYQAPQSMGFSWQEYWNGLPFPSPGDLPDPGLQPRFPSLQTDSLQPESLGKPPLRIFHHNPILMNIVLDIMFSAWCSWNLSQVWISF